MNKLLLFLAVLCCAMPVCENPSGNDDDTPQPKLSILYPKGGELFRVGDTVAFKIATTDTIANYLIDATKPVSNDNGMHWANIVYTSSAGGTTVHWVVPETLVYIDDFVVIKKYSVSDSCYFKIAEYDDANINAVNKNPFRISAAR